MPKDPFSMMLSGSSGSGKTVLAMNIVTKHTVFGWCSWLSRQSNTLEVPSSTLGSNIPFPDPPSCQNLKLSFGFDGVQGDARVV